jgi:beta-glucosidase-like glycosyl hydrolase
MSTSSHSASASSGSSSGAPPISRRYHPFFKASQVSESLQTELDILLATTNAEEQLARRQAELTIAGTSASFKQLQYYRRQRKEILQRLIQEKRDYILLLKQKIAEFDRPSQYSMASD